MCSCPFSWIISLARSVCRLISSVPLQLLLISPVNAGCLWFSPFSQKEPWLTDLCCPLTDMISRWNHQLRLSKVHQDAIVPGVSQMMWMRDVLYVFWWTSRHKTKSLEMRWPVLKKLNAENILGLNNPISWKWIHYPILLHHCCNIIVDDYYMIN